MNLWAVMVSRTKTDHIQLIFLCMCSICVVCVCLPALNLCGKSYVHQVGPAVGTSHDTAPV